MNLILILAVSTNIRISKNNWCN